MTQGGRRRRRAAPLLLAVAVPALLVACTQPDPEGAARPSSPAGSTPVATTSEPSSTGAPSTSDPAAFDCAAVEVAAADLADAFDAELSRLDIGSGDPRAQTVYALVTTVEGPQYWSQVVEAAPDDLRADAITVRDYYELVADGMAGTTLTDGSQEELDAGVQALVSAGERVGDPETGADVVAAQERVQTALDQGCSDPSADGTPSAAAGATTSPTG